MNINQKKSKVKPVRLVPINSEPQDVEKGMLVQVVESGKYYEYNGESWIEIEAKEALLKWEKRKSGCLKEKP